jgi:uncharacterized protein
LLRSDRKNKTSAPFYIKTYERFLKIRGNPREIALGFALGIFIGFTPTLGLHMAIAVFFAALLKWNKIASAVGVWITNPATAPFIYAFTYLVGAKILGINNKFALPSNIDWDLVRNLFEKTPEVFVVLTIGGIVLGLPFAVAGYYLSFYGVQRYREQVKEKVAKQREKLRRIRDQRREKKTKRKAAGVKSRIPK